MARPKSAIKLVSLKLFCNECGKEVSSVSVAGDRRDPRFAIDYGRYSVEAIPDKEEPTEAQRVVCPECGTPLTSPIEFFCPQCFEESGYYDDGVHVQGQLLKSIHCVKAMLKEFKYIKSPYWRGRDFFVGGHHWRPHDEVTFDDVSRMELIETAASYGLLPSTGNIAVDYDRDNNCKMYLLETREGWYCFEYGLDNQLEIISPDLRARVKYDTIATEMFRLPPLRFE